MGIFIDHPREREQNPADWEYAIKFSKWLIDPGGSRQATTETTELNILTMESKAYLNTQPLVAQIAERVQFRNLGAMDHNAIRLHGHRMTLTETGGDIVPVWALYLVNTVLILVGSTRTVGVVTGSRRMRPLLRRKSLAYSDR